LTPTLVGLYVTWALLLALAYAVFILYRHFGEMYLSGPVERAKQGPNVGTTLLSISRSDLRGNPVSLPSERPTLLLFADVTCELCAEIRDSLSILGSHADRLSTIVFCAGASRDVAAWAARTPDFVRIVADERGMAASHYRISTLPFAVAVEAGGTVKAKSIINGGDGLEWAAREALALPVVSKDEVKDQAMNEISEVARA
jgi:hypothetical protein